MDVVVAPSIQAIQGVNKWWQLMKISRHDKRREMARHINIFNAFDDKHVAHRTCKVHTHSEYIVHKFIVNGKAQEIGEDGLIHADILGLLNQRLARRYLQPFPFARRQFFIFSGQNKVDAAPKALVQRDAWTKHFFMDFGNRFTGFAWGFAVQGVQQGAIQHFIQEFGTLR